MECCSNNSFTLLGGRDGKDGKNGEKGRDGLNGKDGVDGKDQACCENYEFIGTKHFRTGGTTIFARIEPSGEWVENPIVGIQGTNFEVPKTGKYKITWYTNELKTIIPATEGQVLIGLGINGVPPTFGQVSFESNVVEILVGIEGKLHEYSKVFIIDLLANDVFSLWLLVQANEWMIDSFGSYIIEKIA